MKIVRCPFSGETSGGHPLDVADALPIPAGMPREALPDGPRKGKTSYTKRSGVNTIEVDIAKKKFFIKKPKVEKPSVSWGKYESIAAAWRAATNLVGGWPRLDGDSS